MKTFLIKWIPEDLDSAYKTLRDHMTNIEFGDFKVPSRGYDEVSSGDNFYVVLMGEEPVVVMRGFFLMDYEPGRPDISIRPTFISAPEKDTPRFSPTQLNESTPGFDWSLYSDSSPLPDWAGRKLSALFDAFLSEAGEALFDGVTAERSHKPEADIDDAIEIASEAYCEETDALDGKPAILSILRVALSFTLDEAIICATLRDIVGRCSWIPGKLRDWGFTERTVDRLIVLKQKEGEDLRDHLLKVCQCGDRLSLSITEADLKDKLSRCREELKDDYRDLLEKLYC